MELYLIEHIRKVETFSEGKIIGITSTKEKAEKVVKEYKKNPVTYSHEEVRYMLELE